jgi:peptidyl-prolyl cis-trans isomerase C
MAVLLDRLATSRPQAAANAAIPMAGVKVPPPPSLANTVSVDGVVIAESAIRAEMQHHPAETGREAFAAAARALVVRELLLAEANRQGLVAAPEISGSGRETDEDAAIRMLLDAAIEVPRADAETCLRHYRAHPARFTSAPIWEARHILLAVSEAEAVRRGTAEQTARRLTEEVLRMPDRFGEVARAWSDCPSAEQGGQLGQVGPGDTAPEFEAALRTLGVGEITPMPVATRFGYHVIVLDRRIDGRLMPFEIVRQRIAGWLEAQSWSRAVAQYVSLLARNAEIVGIDLAMDPQLAGQL